MAWSRQGWLAAGGEAGQIYAVDPSSGTVSKVADTRGFVLGLAFDAADRLYVCDMGRHAVLRVDPGSGTVDDITTGFAETEVRVPNMATFTADGTLFFSDSGDWGANNSLIFARTTQGEVRVASDEARGFANGIALDPDGRHLYVAESSVPCVSRFPLLEGGRLGAREVVVETPNTVPDGIAFAADGRLLICCYRPDALYVWDGSTVELLVSDWTGLTLSAPTGVAFFGDRLDRLVAANLHGQTLVEVHCGMTGATLNFPDFTPEEAGC
ncbi:SMP-30/gluconolactonase/LRE family protein [Streptomyces sp. NPDC004752]